RARPVLAGRAARRALSARLPSLPTYPDRAAWDWHGNGAEFDPGHVLRSSLDTLDDAVRAARSAESANDPIQAEEALQQLTASYLAVRNALPLTSVDTRAPANSRGEGGHRQHL